MTTDRRTTGFVDQMVLKPYFTLNRIGMSYGTVRHVATVKIFYPVLWFPSSLAHIIPISL
jgi:hypothetical protein